MLIHEKTCVIPIIIGLKTKTKFLFFFLSGRLRPVLLYIFMHNYQSQTVKLSLDKCILFGPMPVPRQVSNLNVSTQQGLQISIPLICPRKSVLLLPINTTAHV